MLEIFEIDTAMSKYSINDSSSGLPPSLLVSFFLQVLDHERVIQESDRCQTFHEGQP